MAGDRTSAPHQAAAAERSRAFGTYDLMILIAGVALLLAFGKRPFLDLIEQLVLLGKALFAYFGLIPSRPFGPPQILARTMGMLWGSVLWYIVQVAQVLIVIMTPVFLIMRLRRPRPPLRALLRQPGMVAGLAVAFGLLWVAGWLHVFFFGRLTDATVLVRAAGGTVAVAWICLILSRKWVAEPSWIDRMGRVFGALAIVVGIAAYSLFGI